MECHRARIITRVSTESDDTLNVDDISRVRCTSIESLQRLRNTRQSPKKKYRQNHHLIEVLPLGEKEAPRI